MLYICLGLRINSDKAEKKCYSNNVTHTMTGSLDVRLTAVFCRLQLCDSLSPVPGLNVEWGHLNWLQFQTQTLHVGRALPQPGHFLDYDADVRSRKMRPIFCNVVP